MELEDQVVSYEYAKKLKELGVKQDSLFSWVLSEFGTVNNKSYENRMILTYNKTFNSPHQYSAFTVTELGEILPYKIEWKNVNEQSELISYLMCIKTHGMWHVSYQCMHASRQPEYLVTCEKESDARANTLIFLIENNLINSGKDN